MYTSTGNWSDPFPDVCLIIIILLLIIKEGKNLIYTYYIESSVYP